MGIGATIGAGIFVTAGPVAREAGAGGVMLAFLIAGVACALAGLCYAEFAALAPRGGSAYTYAYSTMGELLAWVIGWDLVLEYLFAGSTVAVELSAHLVELLTLLGVPAPGGLKVHVAFPDPVGLVAVDVLAMAIMAVITAILVRGVEESARMNNVMVLVKVGVVLFVIGVGAWFVNAANWANPPPPAPQGWLPNTFAAAVAGAGIVFFSYIGFDAVSTHAEETREPQGRNLCFGILVSLVICTLLYFGVAVVLTGMIPWPDMPEQAPVAAAFRLVGMPWAEFLILIGAIAGMTSVLIVTFSGQARIFRSMANDGLLPRNVFAAEHPRYRSPHRSLVLTGAVAAVVAGLVPSDELLQMVSIGTLLAFALVCAAVLILRNTNPEFHRPFRCPAVYVVAPLGIAVNVYMMANLKPDAWVRLGAWLAVGLVVYFAYGFWNSAVRGRGPAPESARPPRG
ncbi:MAG: amino acid permease [Isosphaera sp.]|nr:amino acid permease [Isosphaera sp.]